MSAKKKYKVVRVPAKSPQLNIFGKCQRCHGAKKISYTNYQLKLMTVPCPICRGTGLFNEEAVSKKKPGRLWR